MTDGRTDRRKVITIAHPEQSSGELKKKKKTLWGNLLVVVNMLQFAAADLVTDSGNFQCFLLSFKTNII